jgi:hypothetical protein
MILLNIICQLQLFCIECAVTWVQLLYLKMTSFLSKHVVQRQVLNQLSLQKQCKKSNLTSNLSCESDGG